MFQGYVRVFLELYFLQNDLLTTFCFRRFSGLSDKWQATFFCSSGKQPSPSGSPRQGDENVEMTPKELLTNQCDGMIGWLVGWF